MQACLHALGFAREVAVDAFNDDEGVHAFGYAHFGRMAAKAYVPGKSVTHPH